VQNHDHPTGGAYGINGEALMRIEQSEQIELDKHCVYEWGDFLNEKVMSPQGFSRQRKSGVDIPMGEMYPHRDVPGSVKKGIHDETGAGGRLCTQFSSMAVHLTNTKHFKLWEKQFDSCPPRGIASQSRNSRSIRFPRRWKD